MCNNNALKIPITYTIMTLNTAQCQAALAETEVSSGWMYS